jgi:hypothetical protein
MEKSTVPSNLHDKARFLIIYPPQKYPIDPNKSIKDIAEQANDIVKEVISYAKADYNKATLLGLFLSARQSYIVFDYDNPGHGDCRVLGFKIKQYIKPRSVPATWVHESVNTWKNYPHIVWPLPPLKIVY